MKITLDMLVRRHFREIDYSGEGYREIYNRGKKKVVYCDNRDGALEVSRLYENLEYHPCNRGGAIILR